MSPSCSLVDEYLANLTNAAARKTLSRLREIIRDEVPEATECISYGMPGYKLNGYLVGFAAFKNHCSLFPGGTVGDFLHLLEGYKTSKGTIQFPSDQLLPGETIRTILRARVAQNAASKKR